MGNTILPELPAAPVLPDTKSFFSDKPGLKILAPFLIFIFIWTVIIASIHADRYRPGGVCECRKCENGYTSSAPYSPWSEWIFIAFGVVWLIIVTFVKNHPRWQIGLGVFFGTVGLMLPFIIGQNSGKKRDAYPCFCSPCQSSEEKKSSYLGGYSSEYFSQNFLGVTASAVQKQFPLLTPIWPVIVALGLLIILWIIMSAFGGVSSAVKRSRRR